VILFMMLKAKRLFACLSDDIRLACVLLVHRHGELCVCELVAAIDDSQPKISRHLAQLRNCSLLQDRRQGQWVYYSLHPDLPSWALAVLGQAATAEAETLSGMSQRLHTMSNRPERVAACG
jgi:ArsR family transcriptional regulator